MRRGNLAPKQCVRLVVTPNMSNYDPLAKRLALHGAVGNVRPAAAALTARELQAIIKSPARKRTMSRGTIALLTIGMAVSANVVTPALSAEWVPGGLVTGAVGAYPGPTRQWCRSIWWTGMPVTGPAYPVCGWYPAVVVISAAARRRHVLRRKF